MQDDNATQPDAPAFPSRMRDETRRVDAVVVALIQEFGQAKVRDSDGHLYALTRMTTGVRLLDLHEGQLLTCTVTLRLPRVVSAVPQRCNSKFAE